MASQSPLISIIIPTYNRAYLLHDTLNSILEQTFTDHEIIIVDNYSTDDTEQLVKGIQDRHVKYVKNNNHGIISINRNYGIKLAVGKYICFCDSDDLWVKDKLRKQYEMMSNHPDMVFSFTNGSIINEKRTITGNYYSKTIPPERITFNTLLTHNYITTLSVMIEKEVLDSVGGFNESIDLVGIEDLHLWLRIAKRYPIHYISDKLFFYRVHDGNKMGVDSWRWGQKCMILAQYMLKENTLTSKDFIKMYSYNAIKYLYYRLYSSKLK